MQPVHFSQPQSPLLGALPREIRNLVYEQLDPNAAQALRVTSRRANHEVSAAFGPELNLLRDVRTNARAYDTPVAEGERPGLRREAKETGLQLLDHQGWVTSARPPSTPLAHAIYGETMPIIHNMMYRGHPRGWSSRTREHTWQGPVPWAPRPPH